MQSLERRIGALETLPVVRGKPVAEMTDAELMAAILRISLHREPTGAEVAQWMALPDAEFRDRLHAMGVLHGNA